MRLRRRLATPLAVLSAAGLLAACGGDGGSSESSVDEEALRVVRAASGVTAEAGSSKVALTSTTDVGGQVVTFGGKGAFDKEARKGRFTFQLPSGQGGAGGGTIEQRVLGDKLYLSLPGQQGVFYELAVSDLAGTSLGSNVDPTSPLAALEGVSDDVKEVGTENVRGAQTTHYSGTYDVSEALERVSGLAKDVLEQSIGRSGLESVPFDAYIDEEGRMRRFEQELTLTASEEAGGQRVTARTVLELFDFGTEVEVEAPPAAQVRDGAPLLAALRQQESGGATPAPTGGAAPTGSATPTASATP